jgi:hypothetical protein
MTQLQPITEPLHPDAFDDVELTPGNLHLHYDLYTTSCYSGSSFYCASPTQIFNLEFEHDSICITDDIERVYIQYASSGQFPIYIHTSFASDYFSGTLSLSECTRFFQFVPIWPMNSQL